MKKVEDLKKKLTENFSGRQYENPKGIKTYYFANDLDFNQYVLPELSKFKNPLKNEQKISIAFVVGPSYLPSILPEMTKFDLLIVADYDLNCLKWIKTMITSCSQNVTLKAHQEKMKRVYESNAPSSSHIYIPYEKAEYTDSERMGKNHFTKRYKLVHDAAKVMCERTHYLPVDLSNTFSMKKLSQILECHFADIHFLNSTNLTDYRSGASIVRNFQTLPFALEPLVVYSMSETRLERPFPQPYSRICSSFFEYKQLQNVPPFYQNQRNSIVSIFGVNKNQQEDKLSNVMQM